MLWKPLFSSCTKPVCSSFDGILKLNLSLMLLNSSAASVEHLPVVLPLKGELEAHFLLLLYPVHL